MAVNPLRLFSWRGRGLCLFSLNLGRLVTASAKKSMLEVMLCHF